MNFKTVLTIIFGASCIILIGLVIIYGVLSLPTIAQNCATYF